VLPPPPLTHTHPHTPRAPLPAVIYEECPILKDLPADHPVEQMFNEEVILRKDQWNLAMRLQSLCFVEGFADHMVPAVVVSEGVQPTGSGQDLS
jgi:hypothetical protein